MEKVRFIHAADLHLGSTFPHTDGAKPFIKEELEKSIEHAVAQMIQEAKELQVDFIILAGDIFDEENRSIRSQIFLKRQLEQLKEENIPVYIVFGNHDPLYDKYAVDTWPEHVHVFSTSPEVKLFQKNGIPLCHLYGCSYKTRHVPDNLAKLYEKKEGVLYHIGILHGQEKMGKEHAPYAPFSTSELKRKEMDYWALGHVHERRALDERIHYPGNIQGRHAKETREKGYLLVELEREQIEVTFRAVSPIVFVNVSLQLQPSDTVEQLTERLLQSIRCHSHERIKGLSVRVHIEGDSALFSRLFMRDSLSEFRELLNDIGATEQPFFFIYHIEDRTKASSLQENTFFSDILQQKEGLMQQPKELETHLSDLFHHPIAKRYISTDNIDKKELIEKGTQLIYYLWEKE